MQALYRWFGPKGELLYIGISSRVMQRTKEHGKTSDWFSDVSFCTVEWFKSREAVELAEVRAITKENPIHNKARHHAYKNTIQIPQRLNKIQELINIFTLEANSLYSNIRITEAKLEQTTNELQKIKSALQHFEIINTIIDKQNKDLRERLENSKDFYWGLISDAYHKGIIDRKAL